VSFWLEADGTPLYLDKLDPNRGVQHDEPNIDCSIMCHIAEKDLHETEPALPLAHGKTHREQGGSSV
jgi:hypothetical protein